MALSGRLLVDTNILIYAYDADVQRSTRALQVIAAAARNDGALPAQVLAEFASVALRKIAIEHATIEKRIAELTSSFTILPLTEMVVREALRGVRTHQFAYYDAQIWAAARLAQIPFVLSEDFSTGAEIEGVSFVNPFDETVDLNTL
jgi:predicted nucleic acid-binding protein